MWQSIGVSLLTYITLIVIYRLISYWVELDDVLSKFIKDILKLDLSVEVVKFFVFNIAAIIISERLLKKYRDKKKTYEYWENEYNNLDQTYNNLSQTHEKLKHHLIIIMQDNMMFFCSNGNSNEKTREKIKAHLEKLQPYLNQYEIDTINNSYENAQYILDKFANKDATLHKIKNQKNSSNKIGY